MRPSSVFYSRYLPRANDLGMYPGGKQTPSTKATNPRPTGSHAIALYMIEGWFTEPFGKELGEPFTVSDFISKFHQEAGDYDEPGAKASSLKARINYLYQGGYLARSALGADDWFIMTEGIEVGLKTLASLRETHLPPPETTLDESPQPVGAGGENSEEEEASLEDDTFLSALRKHGYLPEEH